MHEVAGGTWIFTEPREGYSPLASDAEGNSSFILYKNNEII